jgi:hypothetical protein
MVNDRLSDMLNTWLIRFSGRYHQLSRIIVSRGGAETRRKKAAGQSPAAGLSSVLS